LFASSSGPLNSQSQLDTSLYYINDQGIAVNLRQGGIYVRTFTSSGNWTPSPQLISAFCIAVGPGGGGGSGPRRISGDNKRGGGGGGGGAVTYRLFRAADLSTNVVYSITVPAGGVGGIAQTSDSSDGFNGSASTPTTLISGSTTLMSAAAGSGGGSGSSFTNAGGAGGTATGSIVSMGPYSLLGGLGGAGLALAGGGTVSGVPAGFNGATGPTGGTAGGGIASDSSITNPANTTMYIFGGLNTLTASLATGSAGNSSSLYKTDIAFGTTGSLLNIGPGFAGTGGQAGNNAGTIAGGRGGDGTYGGGAGGGGSVGNGANSGAGGNGGSGLFIIIEYYV